VPLAERALRAEPVRPVVYGHQQHSCHWLSEPCERSQCAPSCTDTSRCHWLSEPCERSQCRSQRPASKVPGWSDVSAANVAQPWGVSCVLPLAAAAATRRPQDSPGWSDVSVANVAQPWGGERRDGAVERLVWHRDQVDRRPQINEFRGGQMRPRPRAAKRPSVCSAWVPGQFYPARSIPSAPRTGLSSGHPLRGLEAELG
jgi:hypothetical protein